MICAILVVGGSYYLVRRAVIRSLSASCLETLQARDWEQLESLAARWRWWERGKATPLLYLAQAAYETDQPERAVELLDQLPDADPDTASALLQRSTLLFDPFNRPLEAVETLERALTLDPTLVEARRRLIYYYAFTLDRRKMVRHAYSAIQYDCDLPETYVYLMAQEWLSFANAQSQNLKWLRSNPDEETFLVAGALYRIFSGGLGEVSPSKSGSPSKSTSPSKEDDVPKHRKVVAELFARFPQNLELLAYFLERSVSSWDVEEVTRLLSSAPSEAADDNRFWRYKGWLHVARSEFAEAEESFRRALSLNPYDFLSRHQLASVARRFKRMDEVSLLEEQHREGQALRRDVLQLPSVDKIPRDLGARMAQYAGGCGEDFVARKLAQRLHEGWGKTIRPPREP